MAGCGGGFEEAIRQGLAQSTTVSTLAWIVHSSTVVLRGEDASDQVQVSPAGKHLVEKLLVEGAGASVLLHPGS